jgi:hypothetical protein
MNSNLNLKDLVHQFTCFRKHVLLDTKYQVYVFPRQIVISSVSNITLFDLCQIWGKDGILFILYFFRKMTRTTQNTAWHSTCRIESIGK